MKFVVVLLALVALASGLEFQEIVAAKERSISSQVVDAIEAAKLQMPCGFPGLGVPPLSPLKLEHKEIKTHGDSLDIEAIFDKMRIYGLDNFDIVEFNINAILSRVKFNFHWHNVNMKAFYDFLLRMHDSNLFTKVKKDGGARMAVKDFVVWGTARYSLGLVGSGGLRLKEFKLYAKVGDVVSEIDGLSTIGIVNRKLNEILEEMIMLTINDNTENIAKVSNDYVVPIINSMIGDKTLGDLLGLIGGGGGNGGEGGDPVEKEPCVPPPDED